MSTLTLIFITTFIFANTVLSGGLQAQETFLWPEDKQVAISLTFDDGRASQVERGVALLDEFGIKATFYVLPSAVEQRPEDWKKAIASGHEIANHSVKHPCSGNFEWSRQNALEEYSLEQIKKELIDANIKIEKLLGVKPQAFAYPCGQTFVGRGKSTQSYVPLVASLFFTGRLWRSEASNDPMFCDFAQLTGVESDGKDFDEILALIESAKKKHQWLILVGHEMGDAGLQTTRMSMLRKLLAYSRDATNGVWIAPVTTVAKYVESKRIK